jgi:RNA polymerase sigma-70 factor (ECF subfamily)
MTGASAVASPAPRPIPASAPAPASASLVSRCVAGEPGAWRALHHAYYPIAGAFLRKLGVGDVDIEDACQEVFVQMHRYLPTFRGQADLKTWLYRLCMTEAGNVRRRFRLADTVRKLLRRELAARPPIDGAALTDDMARRKVDAGLAALKDAERLVFVLYEMEGLAGEQIAEIAGCPVATVWRRLHYARRTFQAAIGEGGLT